MNLCVIFMLAGGWTLGTAECQMQLFVGGGYVTPHEVVYNSHPDDCFEGYLYYIPRHRVHYDRYTKIVRYHVVRARYHSRVHYSGRVYRPLRLRPLKNHYYKRHHVRHKKHVKKYNKYNKRRHYRKRYKKPNRRVDSRRYRGYNKRHHGKRHYKKHHRRGKRQR